MFKIRLEEIRKTFKKTIIAVDGVSLKVKEGEYTALLGSSGSGKTTLLRIIAGLETQDSGEIFIDGKRVSQVPPEKRGIGFVFQDFALFPHLSVWDNVVYAPRVRCLGRKHIDEIGTRVLKIVGLYPRRDSFPHELSGGMKQRVGLARALASGSKILLMDEPLGSLDARIKRDLKEKLKDWVKKMGLTAVHVAHSQHEAMGIADRVFVMSKGKMAQSGKPEELYRHPGSIFVADFIGESNFLTGVVKTIKDKRTVIEVAKSFVIKSSQTGFGVGEKVVVSFRPEEVRLYDKVPKGRVLKGKLIKKKFLQGRLYFDLRLVSRQIIRVNLAPSSHNAALGKGQRVVVRVDPHRVILFPYPSCGLQKELQIL